LIEFQSGQLRSLLAHAVHASPYYRDIFGPDAANGNVPLSELPTLPKATLMDNFDGIVTDPALRLSELEAHVTSAEANRPFRGHRVFSTSGTAGLRGLTVYSHEEFALWTAASLRLFAWAGITHKRGWWRSARLIQCTSLTNCFRLFVQVGQMRRAFRS